MKRTIAPTLIALALVMSACTSGSDSSSDTGPVTTDGNGDPIDPDTSDPDTSDPDDGGSGGGVAGPIGFAPAALQQFGECSAFLDHVRTEGADRVGPYGFNTNNFFGPDIAFAEGDVAFDVAVEAEAAEEPSNGSSAAPAAAETLAQTGGDSTFSGTNVQVAGVDEPDIVKTDGDRILAITGETLSYVDVDGTTGTKRGSIQLSGQTNSYSYGHEIFMAGDRAFVFAQGEGFYGPPTILGGPVAELVEPDFADDSTVSNEPIDAEESFAEAEAPVIDDPIPTEPSPLPGGYFGPSTLIFEIDLSNPDSLAITNTMTIEGRYISARSIGDTARVVVTSPPQDLGFLYPSNPGTEDKAEEANQDIVRSSTVEDWIPNYTVESSTGSITTGQLVECGGIHAPADFSGFDMLSIVTLDLGVDLSAPTGTSTVMASGDTVYASQDRMYISTNIWSPVIDEQSQQWLDENYETAIHRFSIAGNGPAGYQASGSIDGHLLNQFSMNDRDGVFYAATTQGAPWSDSTESQIVAMEMNGDRLEQVGSVGGLGLGERIFSVRYVDDTAYVVTFRQTDPFYVIDIADPREMSVQGELKIPGFSSYLHPIGDSLVIGVGQDATDTGQTTGTKVSLFDVSDPSNPLEVDVWTLPNAYSDAEFDHRAFLYWAPTSTAVLPLQSWGDQFSGAVVLKIGADGIIEQGRITHSDDESGAIGRTDCRVLESGDFGNEQTGGEFFWIAQEGGQVQLCGSNDRGGATGLNCERIPIDDLQNWVGGEGQLQIDPGDAEFFELCWPNWNGYQTAVQRTMVIDGSLWTLSQQRLQANDLTTLDRTGVISL